MELILHVGAHRTGTTTFQRFLHRHAPGLQEAGLETWTPEATRNGLFQGLVIRKDEVSPNMDRLAERSVGLIRLRMDDLWRQARRQLLISEENMLGSVRANLRTRMLYPELGLRLERFQPAFEDSCIRIGLTVRSYEDYWSSCLAFMVAQGGGLPSRKVLADLVALPRRWTDVAAEVAALFPMAEVLLHTFEDIGARPHAYLQSMTGLAQPVASLALPERHNASATPDKLRRILRLRGAGAAAALLPRGDVRWMPFSDQQIARLRRLYAEDLDRFHSRPPAGVRLCTNLSDTGTDRRATTTRVTPDRASEATGFAENGPPWMPPEGGRTLGTERRMV